MNLTWYGHAAFLLEGVANTGNTVRLVLDPYRAPDVGTYAPIDDEADIVAISHDNPKYHSHIEAVRGRNGESPIVVRGLELLDARPEEVKGVPFTGVKVWEDDTRTVPVAMISLILSGLHVLHMGDCGHALAADEIAACGPVDVLLALAGGPPTLPLPELVQFIDFLNPRIIIPMHFGNDKINLNLRPVDDFLSFLPPDMPVLRFNTPTVTIKRESLPTRPEVWVLPPAR